MYYLFSAHHWTLTDLRALWDGDTGWHDLILALSSYEANQKKLAPRRGQPKSTVKVTKMKKK